MTGCGSTEGIDNSPGRGPQGRAGRHSAVLTLHSHITECLALSPALLHSPRPRTTTAPPLHHPAHLHSAMTSLPDLLFSPSSSSAFLSLVPHSISLSYPAIFSHASPPLIVLLILCNSLLDPSGCPHLNSRPSGLACSNLQILQSAYTLSCTVPIHTVPAPTQALET